MSKLVWWNIDAVSRIVYIERKPPDKNRPKPKAGWRIKRKQVTMGFLVFLKKVFGANDEVDEEIIEARKRHNIAVEGPEKKEKRNRVEEMKKRREEDRGEFDVWEELKYYRQNFFLGGWASRKIGFTPNDDKPKEELEALERKREEKRQLKEEKKMRGQ